MICISLFHFALIKEKKGGHHGCQHIRTVDVYTAMNCPVARCYTVWLVYVVKLLVHTNHRSCVATITGSLSTSNCWWHRLHLASSVGPWYMLLCVWERVLLVNLVTSQPFICFPTTPVCAVSCAMDHFADLSMLYMCFFVWLLVEHDIPCHSIQCVLVFCSKAQTMYLVVTCTTCTTSHL